MNTSRKSDMSVIAGFEYQRDANWNPLSIARGDDSAVHYEHDASNHLVGETHKDDQGQQVYAWEGDA